MNHFKGFMSFMMIMILLFSTISIAAEPPETEEKKPTKEELETKKSGETWAQFENIKPTGEPFKEKEKPEAKPAAGTAEAGKTGTITLMCMKGACANAGAAGKYYTGRLVKDGIEITKSDGTKFIIKTTEDAEKAGLMQLHKSSARAIKGQKFEIEGKTDSTGKIIEVERIFIRTESEQDWASGFTDYKTRIVIDKDIDATTGEIKITSTEYVREEMSSEEEAKAKKTMTEEEKKEAEKEGFFEEEKVANKVTVMIDEEGNIASKKEDQYYKGDYIGSFERRYDTEKWEGTFNILGVDYKFDESGTSDGKTMGEIYDELFEALDEGKLPPKFQERMDYMKFGISVSEGEYSAFGVREIKGLSEHENLKLKILEDVKAGKGLTGFKELKKTLEQKVDAKTQTKEDQDILALMYGLANEKTIPDKYSGMYGDLKSKVPLEEIEIVELANLRTTTSGLYDDEYEEFMIMQEDIETGADANWFPEDHERFAELLMFQAMRLEKFSELEQRAKINQVIDKKTAVDQFINDIKIAGLDEQAKKHLVSRLKDELEKAGVSGKDLDDLVKLAETIAAKKPGEMTAEEEELFKLFENWDKMTDKEKEKVRAMLEEAKVRDVETMITQPIDVGQKLGAMNVWQFFGVFVHAYNEYKGIATLTSLIFDWPDTEELAKNKEKLTEDFCAFSGLKHCWTSAICDYYPDSQSGNYVLARGPDSSIPMVAASIVGERSDPIEFKGLDRQSLIDLFGDYTYINKRKVDFTDASLDVSELPITMRLYHAQMIINNPLNKDLHVNVQFIGPGRSPKWFSDWREVEKGGSATRNFIKYSTTEYTKVCLLTKELMEPLTWTAGPWEVMRTTGSQPTKYYRFCVPLQGAGPATSIEGNEQAADDLQEENFGDGAEI